MRSLFLFLGLIFSFASFAQTTVISELEAVFTGNRFLSIDHGDNVFNLWGEKYAFVDEDEAQGPKKLTVYFITNSGKIDQRKTFWIEDGEYRLTGKVNDEKSWSVIPIHPFTQIGNDIDQAEGVSRKELIQKHLDKLVGLDKLNKYKSEFTDQELEKFMEMVPSNLRESWYYDEVMTFLTLNQSARAKLGQSAPDFTLETKLGTDFSLSDQKGKYTLLEFSFTGCAGCILALPELKKIHDQLGNQIQIVSLWKDPKKNTWLNSQADHKSQITWTNVWDPNGLAASLYEIKLWPSYVLIDPNGNVKSIWNGYKKGNNLTRKITREMGI